MELVRSKNLPEMKKAEKFHANNNKKFNLMLHGNCGPLQSVSCSSNYIDKDDAITIITHNQPLLLDFKNHIFSAVGSCNGLLLVLATTGLPCGGGHVLYIWNPTTGEYKTLPHLPSYMPADNIVYGFGPDLTTIDHNHHHYKVLLLQTVSGRTFTDPPIHNFYRYTTHTNSWKPLLQNNGPYGCFAPKPKGMILAYNNLHYVADVVTTVDTPFYESIVSFDLKDDKFRVLPIVDRPTRTLLQSCALNGDLCAFIKSFFGNGDDNLYGLWRMENFGVKNEECWTKIYTIDLRSAMDKPITIVSPLHVLEDGQILLYAEPRYPHPGKPFIVSYNTENKKASFLVQCNVPFYCILVVYEESHISPNAASTVEEELPKQPKHRRIYMENP